MNLHSVKEIVRHYLRTAPETRDDDKLLILKVWAYKEPRLRDPNFSFIDFAKVWRRTKNPLPAAESIRRVRQKLQQHDKTLRSDYHDTKVAHAESVKEELRDPSFKPGGTP